jgi:hypothetical protein
MRSRTASLPSGRCGAGTCRPRSIGVMAAGRFGSKPAMKPSMRCETIYGNRNVKASSRFTIRRCASGSGKSMHRTNCCSRFGIQLACLSIRGRRWSKPQYSQLSMAHCQRSFAIDCGSPAAGLRVRPQRLQPPRRGLGSDGDGEHRDICHPRNASARAERCTNGTDRGADGVRRELHQNEKELGN